MKVTRVTAGALLCDLAKGTASSGFGTWLALGEAAGHRAWVEKQSENRLPPLLSVGKKWSLSLTYNKGFSIFDKVCDHHHCLSLEDPITPKRAWYHY